jgi:hypothetical protein
MMHKLTCATILAGVLTGALAVQAQARPYLMLAADRTGFKALDLGDIHQQGIDTAQATVISAPLAGAAFGDKRAALMKQRVEFECLGERWRLMSVIYADAKEAPLGSENEVSAWQPLEGDPLLIAAKDAACLRRFKASLVSRDLNLGDIVIRYHKAWGPAAPEPMTERQVQKHLFEVDHCADQPAGTAC